MTARARRLAACALGLIFLIGCALVVSPIDPGSRAVPVARKQPPVKHFERVVIVIFENQDFVCAIHDDYLGRLAAKGAALSNYRALFHNSYPNYIALVAGTIFDSREFAKNSDNQIDWPPDHYTIADTLEAAGRSWKQYAEDYPAGPADARPFTAAGQGQLYRRKHVPFLSFTSVTSTENGNQRFKNVVAVRSSEPGNAFALDVKNGTLPSYSFYTPNMINDGHDEAPHAMRPSGDLPKGCEGSSKKLAHASGWLRSFLSHGGHAPRDTTDTDEVVERFPKGTLIVVTFDESGQLSGRNDLNRIYTVLLGDMIAPGVYSEAYNHYNLLRTVEDNFGLLPLAGGDATALPIDGVWAAR